MNNDLQRVWLILAKVKVLGDNPAGLAVGSEALVQCFVPKTVLEIALVDCDRVLQDEGMRRMDVLRCVSFEEIDPEDDVPDFVKRDVHQARSSGKSLTGTFFTSPDTATFEKAESHNG